MPVERPALTPRSFAGIEGGHQSPPPRIGCRAGSGSADVTLRDPRPARHSIKEARRSRQDGALTSKQAASAGATGDRPCRIRLHDVARHPHRRRHYRRFGVTKGNGAGRAAVGASTRISAGELAKAMTPQQVQQKLARAAKAAVGPSRGTGRADRNGERRRHRPRRRRPTNPATSLYDKLKQLEEAHRAQQKTLDRSQDGARATSTA